MAGPFLRKLTSKEGRGAMYDIIVVGGGPAGLTAALYAARAGKSVLVLEKTAPGGQIIDSPLVENYPGLPGVSGADFALGLSAQVERLGVETVSAEVTGLRPVEAGYAAETGRGAYEGRALVLAVGSHHRRLGLEGEEELVGRGVSYCAVCDGPVYKGKSVAVVGGGNTALQDALFLSDLCESVTIIHRRDQFRGEARLVEKLRQRPNIRPLMGWAPEELLREGGRLSGLRLKYLETGEERALGVDGAFIAVGQQPGTDPFAGQVELDEGGYVIAGEDCRTNLPGVFAAGDCRAKEVRQLTTAAADGAVAALAACRYCDRKI